MVHHLTTFPAVIVHTGWSKTFLDNNGDNIVVFERTSDINVSFTTCAEVRNASSVSIGDELVSFSADLEKIEPLLFRTRDQVHIHRVDVGHHHLFDLSFPKVGLAGPIGPPLDRPPRTAHLAVNGGEPVEDRSADQPVRARVQP